MSRRSTVWRGLPATARGAAFALVVTAAAGLGVRVGAAHAATPSPLGLWRTVDDDSGQPKALVRITEQGGALQGRIERLLDPADPPDALCTQCPDQRRNQPIVGLAILRGLPRTPGADGNWSGGEILDPEDGRTYRVRLAPSPDGRRLEVRGYLGVPMFGRSQTWQRVE